MARNLALLSCRDLLIYWRSMVVILVPVIFLPLPIVVGTEEAKCAYVLVIMASYWMAEVVPLAVTSFLPLFLFPILGILDADRTSKNYLKDTNFLFFGGLIVALAVEESNLHKRLALRVLLLVGSKPRWLMMGFMGVTCFLSMWISNTATTAMMVPIALAVLEELVASPPPTSVSRANLAAITVTDEKEAPTPDSETSPTPRSVGFALTTSNGDADIDEDLEHDNMSIANQTKVVNFAGLPENFVPEDKGLHVERLTPEKRGICKGILLSICWAANIGGTGTLTGTGPNLVLRGQLATIYNGADTGITFASWMLFAIPPMIIYLIVAWALLQVKSMLSI